MDYIVLLIHRLVVVLWIGAVAGEGYLASQGKKSEEKDLAGQIGKMKKASLAGRGTGGLITLTGLALVFIIGYDFTETWILVKLLVVISSVAIGALLTGKAYQEIEKSGSDIETVKASLGQITRNSFIILGAAAAALISVLTR